jgi:anti-sigma regulatory factor (Ser/Thr protein kinase)
MRFLHSFPATPAEVAAMRRALEAWLEDVALEPRRRQDAILATSEAAANAAEHAYAFDGVGVVRVEAWVSDGRLQVSVRDEGSWRRPRAVAHRGRGRSIMAAVMEDVTIDYGKAGTVVRMSLPLQEEVLA